MPLNLLFLFFCLITLPASWAQATFSQQEIEKLAKNWLVQQLQAATPEVKYKLSFANPGQNLTYKSCSSPLTVSQVTNEPLQGRVNLRITCTTENWFSYLGVNIDTYAKVAIAKKHLTRGARLSSSLIEFKEVATTNLKDDYFTHPNELLGKNIKASLRAGRVITSRVVELADTVNKGDLVTLSSSSGRLKVRIQVEAVTSGKVGQQIRVKNLQSGKQIRALVIGQGQVEAL